MKTLNLGNKIQYFALPLAIVLIFAASSYAFGLLSTQTTMNSTGLVASANLGLYSDSACTNTVSAINWGTVYPAGNYTTTIYMKNLGTVNETLTIQITNWTPSSASPYLTITSSYAGQTLSLNQVLPVTFTLRVSQTITGIASFSNNIVITSQG